MLGLSLGATTRFALFANHCEAAMLRPNNQLRRPLKEKSLSSPVRAAVSERPPLGILQSWAQQSFWERGVRIVSTRSLKTSSPAVERLLL
jgi:hypothetical protein